MEKQKIDLLTEEIISLMSKIFANRSMVAKLQEENQALWDELCKLPHLSDDDNAEAYRRLVEHFECILHLEELIHEQLLRFKTVTSEMLSRRRAYHLGK